MTDQITIVTPPEFLPVSVEQVKDWSRITHTSDDAVLVQIIKAAAEYIEGQTWRYLIRQTVEWHRDGFGYEIRIPRGPVASITSIKYIDDDDVEQTVSADDYQVSPRRGVIIPAYGATWPTPKCQLDAVTVRAALGYADPTAVPKDLRVALLMVIDDMYEHRSAQSELRLEDNDVLQRLLWANRWHA